MSIETSNCQLLPSSSPPPDGGTDAGRGAGLDEPDPRDGRVGVAPRGGGAQEGARPQDRQGALQPRHLLQIGRLQPRQVGEFCFATRGAVCAVTL